MQPLLVFDGPDKPPFKRGRRTLRHAPSLLDAQSKQLLGLLGIPFHDAPGEAEAECAFLQREGIVDAVLSEDVDAIMFGCQLMLRNWSPEGTRGSKTPTHVSMYDANTIRNGKSGLTAKGVLLVALMSGGDYNPAGVPGCGVKVACEAARAGFGESLCKLSASDVTGIRAWRKQLSHELQTNENKFFKVKHKAIPIPEEFPDKAVLDFYLKPSVSSHNQFEQLSLKLNWEAEPDISQLRQFVANTFDWQYLGGAKKFVRGIAQPLLVRRLVTMASLKDQKLVDIKRISGRRLAFAGDGMPEIRVEYIPLDMVGLDLSVEDLDGVQKSNNTAEVIPESKSATESVGEEDERQTEGGSLRKPQKSFYDPCQVQKLWTWEAFVKAGAPAEVRRWEEDQRNLKKAAKKQADSRGRKARGGMEHGALDRFVKITKPSVRQDRGHEAWRAPSSSQKEVEFVVPDIPATSSQNYVSTRRGSPLKKKAAQTTQRQNVYPPTKNKNVISDNLQPTIITITSSPVEPSSSHSVTTATTSTIATKATNRHRPPPSPSLKQATSTTKRMATVALRDSLNGAWRESDEQMTSSSSAVVLGSTAPFASSSRRVWRSVEVLDLTEGRIEP